MSLIKTAEKAMVTIKEMKKYTRNFKLTWRK